MSQIAIEKNRLHDAYFSALGEKKVVQSACLLPGFFPNDGNYPTRYQANMTGLLLDNLNMGDNRKKIGLGSVRYDLWFTFIEKKKSLARIDERY